MLRNRKGFTLVEVVVVLVILGILAAVMIPALTGWIDDARKTECRSKMGMVARDYHTWVADYGYGLVTPVAGNEATLLNSAVTDILNRAATGNNTYTCPYGGNCTVTFAADGLAITQITCSLHGTVLFGGGGGAMAAMTDQEIGDAIKTALESTSFKESVPVYGFPDSSALTASPGKQAFADSILQKLPETVKNGLAGKYWVIKPTKDTSNFKLYFYSEDALSKRIASYKDQSVPVYVYDSAHPELGVQTVTGSVYAGTVLEKRVLTP